MKALVAIAFLLAFTAGPALAQYQHISEGPPGGWIYLPLRDEVCQYGFQDDYIGGGATLGLGQQLGIECPDAGCISAVGFYCEFLFRPGDLDIVVYDDGVEVSRTTLVDGTILEGTNEFDIEDVSIAGDACIMLCAVDDDNGFGGVTGEDMTNGPWENCYFSNTCTCENMSSAWNYTIWAVLCGPVATDEMTWGSIRTMYR